MGCDTAFRAPLQILPRSGLEPLHNSSAITFGSVSRAQGSGPDDAYRQAGSPLSHFITDFFECIASAQQELLYGPISPVESDISESMLPLELQWPDFGSAAAYSSYMPDPPAPSTYSPSYSFPDVTYHYSSVPHSPKSSDPPPRTWTRNRSPNHVPRPRNAFMLFRSDFLADQKLSTNIEHDHRHISRIIAHCWNGLPEVEKKVWRDKAATEKALHALKYPNYRFAPVGRAKKPVKRKVKRNGNQDRKRCEQVAELLLAGKQGNELENAVKEIDVTISSTADTAEAGEGDDRDSVMEGISEHVEPGGCNVPPFRSPILPPTELPAVHSQPRYDASQHGFYTLDGNPFVPVHNMCTGADSRHSDFESPQGTYVDLPMHANFDTHYSYAMEPSLIQPSLSVASNHHFLSGQSLDYFDGTSGPISVADTPYLWAAPAQFNYHYTPIWDTI
ncbi:hypothetical protein SERLADRAFT_442935 [Serpula lacrymans var. lacrymans S7.9]|uniref:HMG box domain-containing protein n=1 Tax=Serpula lacrymans var. lacrymans (strain S7.9) TaxID=578457 RepID=F8PB19_SERL9|nr:uncharacterized protein SERLADRAFT_442935 [Serpula lacrymans var. lacrymans S7.9]EGO19459.1 hypothetical protein SERLADRAFT_442935 [Serpula lacrymans var. lacrymans S7.9]